jgi:aminopeptidase N
MTTARIEEVRLILIAVLAMMLLGSQPFQHRAGAAPLQGAAPVQAAPAAEVSGDIDVADYKIDADLAPTTNTLRATAVVTFRALKQSRSVTFELNGSLRVAAVRGADGKPLQFAQDTLQDFNVKVDMGQVMAVGQSYALTFDYAGQLVTAEGGPLPDRRLAYVGPEGAYLHYASRWFPFHEYGADRATMNLRISMPSTWKLAAHSDTPLAPVADKAPGTTVYTVVESTPVLPGTLAAGPYIVVPVQTAGVSVDVYASPGSESAAQGVAEAAVDILDYYQKTFGPYAFGRKYVVAQIDDESLDALAGAGIELISSGAIKRGRDNLLDDLARQIALQWWGQAVGLKSFDATWLSQGLAEYSSTIYRMKDLTTSASDAVLSELGERALSYENEASITQAPSQLNDQTPAFRSIVLYKGAYVFHMLRGTMGDDKFFAFLRDYYARNKGKNVAIPDFERQATAAAGQDLRWFFGLWVESTGVPEFKWDYTIIKTKTGDWRVRGTLKESLEGFRMPVEVLVSSTGGEDRVTLSFNGQSSADFLASPKGANPTLIIDPDRKILRVSDSIRTAVVVRRGIQEMQEGNFIEAENRLRDAIKLAPRSSWAWYNLGLLYMKQANTQKAVDAFTQALAGDLDPKWIEVWSYVYRGNAYDALGQRDRAVAEYDKAVEVGDDYDGAQEAAQKYKAEPYRPTH